MKCAGDSTETCGGANTLTLYKNPANSPSAPTWPAGWNAAGCIVDNVNKTRTLSSYSFFNNTMTYTTCINKCESLGYKLAGVEYSVSLVPPAREIAMTAQADLRRYVTV